MGVRLPERVYREAESGQMLLTPLFYHKLSTLLSKKDLGAHEIFFEEYDELSRYLDKTAIQESTSVRNILKTRAVATALISDEGEL